ncbi:hypothetical protein [Caudoviricetes sp.]|nr:hypothetical protein [Caudoviricetes sp.]
MVKFEKEGKFLTVNGDKENIFCMESAGWKIVDKTIEKPDNPIQSKDETEGTIATPSGDPVKRRGRPPKG